MTTHVPDGTPAESVDDIRAREAVRAGQLATQGTLLRLWRPPLQPGEWRTLGLFAADDDEALEKALASMPLRVWRTDAVTPLGKHPNDPGHTTKTVSAGTEFLITMTVTVPPETPSDLVQETFVREAARAVDLAAQGHLLRLWALPSDGDRRATLGSWSARHRQEMSEIMDALPLRSWMEVEVVELSEHPSDPAHGPDHA